MDKQRRTLIEEYEVNPCTLMVKPTLYGSKLYARIIEMEDEYISPFKPLDIIKKSCEYFGSSYEGRKQGTRTLIGITHKVPITIDPVHFIYFFPTTSPNNNDCIWISHENVLSHQRVDSQQTLVTFRNKKHYTFPISSASFENQLLRTALLRTKIMQRLEETERKAYYFSRTGRYMEASESHHLYQSEGRPFKH
ncbi:transcriptional regulator [Bacillus sp. V3-13]|uniref:competence protein ComK n=1 Tax=Bacillus sp. V3-13 TaxID=2053728 RepID=UPI000C783E30|nr:competence protein ComK [Bacillus sp. V3-13]PLR78899.1 transcriptional regulator [Bacillus sp. V3-13]